MISAICATLLSSSCLRPAFGPPLEDEPAISDSLSPADETFLLQTRFAQAEALARGGQEFAALDSLRSLFFDLRSPGGVTDSVRWSLQLAATREMARLLERTGPDPAEDEGISSLDYKVQLLSDRMRGEGSIAESVLESVLAEDQLDSEADSLLEGVLDAGDSLTIRLNVLPEIPDCDRADVERMVEYFASGKGRKYYQIWLDRYPAVAPTILRVLKEEGMPDDLLFLAMIESGLRVNATSRAKARGPWQFITGTAHLFDLRVDYWMDERLDLELATRAACRFMRKLYNRYGDWYLAMAAYNWGPGRIDRAVARGVKDYWSIERMPSETRNYVPTYLAARRVFQDRELHGFVLEPMATPPDLEQLSVNGSISLTRLADLFAIEEQGFRDVNHHLVQGSTPPDGGHVYVPADVAGRCRDRLRELPESAFRDWIRHKVKRGESLAGIARRYGVSLSDLRHANKMGSKTRLKTGRTLLVPLSTQERVSRGASADDDSTPTRNAARAATHKVRRGETLTSIARRYGSSVSELAAANKLSVKTKLKTGARLRIPGGSAEDAGGEAAAVAPREGREAPVAKGAAAGGKAMDNGVVPTHRVRRGDVLDRIARRYGLSVSNLMTWNQLQRADRIYPGQELLLADPDSVERVDRQAIEMANSTTRPSREGSRGEAKVVATPPVRTHVVRAGETAGAIAQRYGIGLKQLTQANKLGNRARIVTGQRLRIPGADTDAQQVIHVVRTGESLWSLARQYKVKVADIRRWNNLRGSEIHAGSRLVIILSEEG